MVAADAGGFELTSTFYTDGQVESESQNGQTIGYQLDPVGRPRQTVDTGTVNSTYVSHYTGSGNSPAWTVEPVSGHWTRYVMGIGGLAAIETDAEEPVLQLHDLQGNIVLRASCSETATNPFNPERPTEYGVPVGTKPAKYSWHGSNLSPTELSSGQVSMGARSYIPQLGRFLQTDPVSGGSANGYAYTDGNPVNESDPSGELTYGISEGGLAEAESLSEATVTEALAREQAAREEAEFKAAMLADAVGGAADIGLPKFLVPDFIEGAYWQKTNRGRAGHVVLGWTLVVKPHGVCRVGCWADLKDAWNQVVSAMRDWLKKTGDKIGAPTKLNDSMYKQFKCHAHIAFWKSTFKLDMWRPDVGEPTELRTLCNPSGSEEG